MITGSSMLVESKVFWLPTNQCFLFLAKTNISLILILIFVGIMSICIYLYTGWWFGTFLLCFHILGISSSQLMNSYFSEGQVYHQPVIYIIIYNHIYTYIYTYHSVFFRGVGLPPTRQINHRLTIDKKKKKINHHIFQVCHERSPSPSLHSGSLRRLDLTTGILRCRGADAGLLEFQHIFGKEKW